MLVQKSLVLTPLLLIVIAVVTAGCSKPFEDLLEDIEDDLNGHTFVDLGLPSGTLWATCDVGANTPEGYGAYFAWGETHPKSVYNWSTYEYCNGSENTLTKYCNDSHYGYNGFSDLLTTLKAEDDAATVNWGSGWRMPTKQDFDELYQNTSHHFAYQNGVFGMLYLAANGNSLFLPAAGWYDSNYHSYTYDVYRWSSTLCDVPRSAWAIGYYVVGDIPMSPDWRYRGFPVRPVRTTH